MSSHLLLLLFFFPLTRPHEAEEWQPLPISAAVSAEIGRIGSCFCRNQPVLAQIGENLAELVRISINKKKKEKGRVGELDARRRIGPRRTLVQRPWSGVGAF